jgi:hypothetical protein
LGLSASANEVGLDSAGPTRFGAKFSEEAGQRVAQFNGDHGILAFFTFAADGETAVSVMVKGNNNAHLSLKGRLGATELKASFVATGQPQWVNLGTAKVLANQPMQLTLDAPEHPGSVVISKFQFDRDATATPVVHFKTAYAANKEVNIGDRGGVGAATFKGAGLLLVPVVVEKAGNVTLAARYNLATDAKVELLINATADYEAGKPTAAPVTLALTGTGKINISKDFTLSFPAAGTYLIAITEAKATDTPITINGLLLRQGTNANLWSLPNGNAQSVHFGYPIPKGETALWAYAEATAQPGPITTYNCVLGFGQGYFGFQRKNSGPNASDRCFIYSLWDNGYIKNNAKNDANAEELKNAVTRLIAKGEGVTASAFDHEGSGGHSHWDYAWKDNQTYAFLLGVKPDGDGAIFSTWVKLSETNQWKFLTSFRRPKTNAKLDGLYSFVEDWSGSAGYVKRTCLYSNLWIYNTQNKWIQLREAHSSATSELGRKDYDHYVQGNGVVLSTGGYGPAKGSRGVTLKIPESTTPPTVDLTKLPNN